MLKFFRRIRQTLLSENKFSKYLLYAIGEIVLVVIGILIALAINNAYNKNKEREDVRLYYLKIVDELEANMAYFQYQVDNRNAFKRQGINALKMLAEKNKDSLPSLLRNIGALKTINSLSPSFPTIEEFLSQNLSSKIANDSIKAQFLRFSEMYKFIGLVDKYTIDQYQISIEPYLTKNFNYSDISYEGFYDIALPGGPSSKTENIWTDLQLWNLISNKLETWRYEEEALNWGIEVLEKLKLLIEEELIDD